jgi:hypothetical protein
MKRYILRRLGQALITIVGISMIVFLLIHLRGDPVALMAPQAATKEDIESLSPWLYGWSECLCGKRHRIAERLAPSRTIHEGRPCRFTRRSFVAKAACAAFRKGTRSILRDSRVLKKQVL